MKDPNTSPYGQLLSTLILYPGELSLRSISSDIASHVILDLLQVLVRGIFLQYDYATHHRRTRNKHNIPIFSDKPCVY